MKLIGLSPCCFSKVSAIKRCPRCWVSASQMSASKSIASKNSLLPNQKIMITMEFDEMKKIWDAQNNQPLYVIDEKALHNRIQSKMNTVLRLTNISEWSLIMIYLVAGGILIGLNPFKPEANIFLYLEAIWMFAVDVYFVVS